MRQLHPVFNVVKLSPALEDPISRQRAPPLPVLADSGVEYKVEKILDSCLFHCKLQYKVKWKGYSIKDISWEPSEDVHALALIWDFHRLHPDAPQTIWGVYPLSLADQAIREFFYPACQDAAP